MKALSLWQPHASLVVSGIKPYETRTWPAPRSIVGQRIWIHAAKADKDLIEIAEYYADWKAGAPKESGMHAYLEAMESMGFGSFRDLPRGCIVGSAVLESSARAETLIDPGPFGGFSAGRFAWRMTDPVKLAEPIPFRGMQGFFTGPDAPPV